MVSLGSPQLRGTENYSDLFNLLLCLQPRAIPGSSDSSSSDTSSEDYGTGFRRLGHGFWSVEHHMVRCWRRETLLSQEMKSENSPVETSLCRSMQWLFSY